MFSLTIIFASTFGKEFDIRADDDPTDQTTAPTVPTIPSGQRGFSIVESNAPNTQYEWDAVQCLAEAYILRPTNILTVIEAFSQLFTLKYPGNWNTHAGCSNSLYIPRTGIIRMDIRVTDSAGDTILTLYN